MDVDQSYVWPINLNISVSLDHSFPGSQNHYIEKVYGTQSILSRNVVRSSQPPLLPSEGHTENTQISQDSSPFPIAVSGGSLARSAVFLFPTIMITMQMITAQRDLSTGAENIICDTNQTLLERGLSPLHIVFLKYWQFFILQISSANY